MAATLMADACVRGVARYAQPRGWHLTTDMMHTGVFPRGWRGDGIIAVSAFQPELIGHIQATALPCVTVPLGDDPAPFPSVRGDHRAVGRMAADHLLERGYRSFVWAPFIGDQVNRDRCLGFEVRLAEHGCLCHSLPPAHRRIGGYWRDDWADYRRVLLARLQQVPRPTAIFAATDCLAAEIIDACRELTIAVPDEISVLGIGNDRVLCESMPVPLSSVELNVEELAFGAAAALDDIIRGHPGPDCLVVPPRRVVTRLSTDTCAVGNIHVARALSYIGEHFPEPALDVAAVAAAVGLSRRQLERSFRTETGCTVHEHIIKRRMYEASRLLRTHPRAKVAAIAELVGLDGAGTFFRTFRRFFGESPRTHRQGTAATPAIEPGEPTRRSA